MCTINLHYLYMKNTWNNHHPTRSCMVVIAATLTVAGLFVTVKKWVDRFINSSTNLPSNTWDSVAKWMQEKYFISRFQIRDAEFGAKFDSLSDKNEEQIVDITITKLNELLRQQALEEAATTNQQ